jgi:hypothetical protein
MPFTAPALCANAVTVRRAACPAGESERTARTKMAAASKGVRKESLRSKVVGS